MGNKLWPVLLAGVVGGLILRRLALRRGATDEEVDASFAGDEVIPHPTVETTHAITIAAPPSAVWPWLIQMGHRGAGRAGWYSDRWSSPFLEAGFMRVAIPWMSRHDRRSLASAYQILPEFQHTAVGDIVPDGPPGAPEFVVKVVDPEQAWVLYSDTHIKHLTPAWSRGARWASYGDFTFAFILLPLNPRGARLILRTRVRFGPRRLRPLFVPLFYAGEAVVPGIMLRGIKARAEERGWDRSDRVQSRTRSNCS